MEMEAGEFSNRKSLRSWTPFFYCSFFREHKRWACVDRHPTATKVLRFRLKRRCVNGASVISYAPPTVWSPEFGTVPTIPGKNYEITSLEMLIQLFNFVEKRKWQICHKTILKKKENCSVTIAFFDHAQERNMESPNSEQNVWNHPVIRSAKTNTCIRLNQTISLQLKESVHSLESCCTRWVDRNHGSSAWNKEEDYKSSSRR